MRGSRYTARGCLAVSLLSLFWCGLAEAQLQGGAALHIDCPALADEERSALEARARAQMVAEPRSVEGSVRVACAKETAVVSLDRGDGSRELRVQLRADRVLAIDDVLAAIHELRSEGPTADAPRAAIRAERGSLRLGVLAGVVGELWHGEIAMGLGPRVGVRVGFAPRWSAELDGSVAWGLNAASGVRGQVIRGSWTLAFAPLRPIELGVGADLLFLVAEASGEANAEQRGVTAGGIARARWVFGWGPFSLSVGPQLELLAEPLVVQLGRAELFRIPNLVGGLLLDVEGDFVR